MKRRPRNIITICVCLLLGAIVNVAVAWGSASTILFDDTKPVEYFRGTNAGDWTVELNHRVTALRMIWKRKWSTTPFPHEGLFPPGEDILLYEHEGMRPQNAVPSWFKYSRTPDPTKSEEYIVADARGWPCYCLWCVPRESYFLVNDEMKIHHLPIRYGILLGENEGVESHSVKVLPLRPIWPGFAINTVFYAAVLWLLLIGPGRLRRFIRRRRGLCPACAYPIGTNNLCTECGLLLRY